MYRRWKYVLFLLVPLNALIADLSHLQLRGLAQINNSFLFSIRDVSTNQSNWCEIGDILFGASIENFDTNNNTLFLRYNGASHELRLMAADESEFKEPQLESTAQMLSFLEGYQENDQSKEELPALVGLERQLYISAQPRLIARLVDRGYSVPQSKIDQAVKKLKREQNSSTERASKVSSLEKSVSLLPLVTTSETMMEKKANKRRGYE